jgi:hypothetical protein
MSVACVAGVYTITQDFIDSVSSEYYGSKVGDSNYCALFDINHDGVIDGRDITWLAQHINQTWIFTFSPESPQPYTPPSSINCYLTVSSSPPNGGETSPLGTVGPYESGTSIVCTAIPADGYNFDHWEFSVYQNGITSYPVPNSTTNPVTVVISSTEMTATAIFTPVSTPPPSPPVQNSTVTITISGQGTTSPPPGTYTSYPIGGTLDITATPASGWQYQKIQRNGVDYTTNNPAEIQNLATTENIEVFFAQTTTTPPPTPTPSPAPTAKPLFPYIHQIVVTSFPQLASRLRQLGIIS